MPMNANNPPRNIYGATVSQTQPFAFPAISPSLDGRVLGDIEDGDKPRLAIRAAIDGARAAAETALANVRAIHGNPEWPEGRKHVEGDAAAARVTTPALVALDKAITGLETRIADVKGVTAPPPASTDPGGVVLAGEIRAKLSSMPPGKRVQAILESINAGEDTVVSAALDGPTFLTGLSALERRHIAATWQKKNFSGETARLALLEKDLDHLIRTRNVLARFQTNCADPRILAAAESPAAKAHASAVQKAEAAAAGRPLSR